MDVDDVCEFSQPRSVIKTLHPNTTLFLLMLGYHYLNEQYKYSIRPLFVLAINNLFGITDARYPWVLDITELEGYNTA